MNELRKKIENIRCMTPDNDHGDEMVPITHVISPDTIDAILDAVIAALPKPPEDWRTHPQAKAQKEYYDYAVETLQAAKENP